MSSEFEIKRLLEITKKNKYAATVAAFEVVDLIDQIKVPKNFENRKPSIRAMQIMSEKTVRYDFISDEQRASLYEELGGEPEFRTEEIRTPSATDIAEKIFAPAVVEDDEKEDDEKEDEDSEETSTEPSDKADEDQPKEDSK